MKNKLITLALLITSSSLFAQIKKVDEVNASMTQGTNRGFKVLIPETSEKEVIKAWSKLMKDYDSKSEKIKKEDEYQDLLYAVQESYISSSHVEHVQQSTSVDEIKDLTEELTQKLDRIFKLRDLLRNT